MNPEFFIGYESKFTLTYHYLGDSSNTRKTIFPCRTILDAINRTLNYENWRPIVFDTFEQEEVK